MRGNSQDANSPDPFSKNQDLRSKNSALNVPVHIGYILDGNRRWAKKHGLPTYEGHIAGVTALEDVIEATIAAGVKYISFYTWSTENWSRAEDEVRSTMKLVRSVFMRDLKRIVKEDCRLVVLGDRQGIPEDIQKYIEQAEADTADGQRATLIGCFNYGGQQEIVRAANRLVEAKLRSEHGSTVDVSVSEFEQYIDHPEIPPCDLIVRTSGEQRLSNFMLWRSAYSEFIFLEKYWPDMKPDDVTAILEEYNRRNRRHGG